MFLGQTKFVRETKKTYQKNVLTAFSLSLNVFVTKKMWQKKLAKKKKIQYSSGTTWHLDIGHGHWAAFCDLAMFLSGLASLIQLDPVSRTDRVWRTVIYRHSSLLERQHLIGSSVAGFNLARTITKASATGLDTRQDEYNKGICSPGN